MKPETGIVLRLVGPLIEIVCAAILMKTWGEGRTVMGVRLETLLYLGFAVGLGLVIAGLTLVRRPQPARPPSRD